MICEVAAFSESTNARLREVADAFLDLSTEPEQFLIGYRSRRPASDTASRRKPEKETGEKAPRRKKGDDDEDALRKVRITY